MFVLVYRGLILQTTQADLGDKFCRYIKPQMVFPRNNSMKICWSDKVTVKGDTTRTSYFLEGCILYQSLIWQLVPALIDIGPAHGWTENKL